MAYDKNSLLDLPYYDKYASRGDVHPIYARYAHSWRLYELCHMGGPEFYRPDVAVNWVMPFEPRITPEQERANPEYNSDNLPSFLRPHNREEPGDYHQRILRSVRVNMCRPTEELYTAQLYSRQVIREARNATVWAEAMSDVDLRGNSIEEFMRQAAAMAIIYGHVHVLTDMSGAPDGSEPSSLGEQLEYGVRPFLTLVRPLELVNWEVDKWGRFIWARIVECDQSSYRLRPEQTAVDRRLYRTWFRDHWEIAGETGKDEGEHPRHPCIYCGAPVEAEGLNMLGRVPLETFYRKRVPGTEQPIGVSLLADIAPADIEIFNLLSLRQALTHDQGIPILAVPDPARQIKGIDLLVHRALPYNPANGGAPPTFVSHEQDSVRILDEQIDSWITYIRAQAGLSRGVADKSIAARSGISLLIEGNDKAAILRAFALEAQDFERRVAQTISDMVGQEFEQDSIRYPERYDTSTLEDDVSQVKAFFELGPSAEVRTEVMKLLVSRILSHVDRDRLNELLETLEAKAEISEAKVDLLTPTDLANVVRVNEARAQVGLELLPEPEGSMTVMAFRALQMAQARMSDPSATASEVQAPENGA